MRMTATGVVRVSPQRSPFLVRPHNFLDHGSTWNACSCDESTVSVIIFPSDSPTQVFLDTVYALLML